MKKSPKAGYIFTLILLIAVSGFIVPQPSQASNDSYPKLANYYTKWDINNDSEIQQLARWDMIILSAPALERNPELIKKIKKYNPEAKVFVYVLLQDVGTVAPTLEDNNSWKKIYQAADQNNWWLRDSSGNFVSWWPASRMINPNSGWRDYLPSFVYNNYLAPGKEWDGVFYDNAWDTVTWLESRANIDLDIDGNGRAEPNQTVDQKWQAGIQYILSQTRSLAPAKPVVANANGNLYNPYLNGRMIENFPLTNEGDWSDNMQKYLNNNLGYAPKYFIINRTTYNTGNSADYASVRYGLSSTLLGDGYYSFDYGDWGHDRLWWYDEYEIYLGNAIGNIKDVLNGNSVQIKEGVWRRDFENGIVLVNSGSTEQTVTLNGEFEAIKGTQDPATNDGAVIRKITLKPNDGRILKKRLDMIYGAGFNNGSFVRVFNQAGAAVRNGFFLYDSKFFGGTFMAKADINHDQKNEILSADKSKITIFDDQLNVLKVFYPYGNKYVAGINFALGDFNHDQQMEIVTGTNRGGGPQVKIFKNDGTELNKGFFAYDKNFRGGVNVAVGDTTGDGTLEIITGAGYMGGPLVRIFDINGRVLSGGFFAYAKTFRGGVNVAAGDINGDGKDEIVTGAGIGGSSHVRIFNAKFQAISSFWAFDQTSRDGAQVYLGDLDRNGIKEILATTPNSIATVFGSW